IRPKNDRRERLIALVQQHEAVGLCREGKRGDIVEAPHLRAQLGCRADQPAREMRWAQIPPVRLRMEPLRPDTAQAKQLPRFIEHSDLEQRRAEIEGEEFHADDQPSNSRVFCTSNSPDSGLLKMAFCDSYPPSVAASRVTR